jgi:outer membrane protein assembly factor BamE (lipoprotein component of BamABCDE complex)
MKKAIFAPTLILTALTMGALSIGACTPIVETRGNLVSETKVAQIHPAISSRSEVEQIWGPPTTVAAFDPNTWYYIGETTEREGIYEAKVTKRQMIKVTFGPDDLVDKVAALDPKNGREIAFVDRKTSTAGKEFTAFQQFVGNLGKFNSDDISKK